MSQRLVAKPVKSFKPSLVKRKPKPVPAAAATPTAETATPLQNESTAQSSEQAQGINTSNERPREASVRPEQAQASPAPQSSAQASAPSPPRPVARLASIDAERNRSVQPESSVPEAFRPSSPRRAVEPIRQPSPPRAASPQVTQARQVSETPQVRQSNRPAYNNRQPSEAIELESAPPTQQTQQSIPYNEATSPQAQTQEPAGLREFANMHDVDAERARAFAHMDQDPDSALAMLANTAFNQSQPEASTSALPEPEAEEPAPSKKRKAKEGTGKKKKARTEDGEGVIAKGKGKKKDGTAKKKKKKATEVQEEEPEMFVAPAKKRKLGASRTAAERRADQIDSADSGFDTETREAEKAKKKKKKKAPRQAVDEPAAEPSDQEEGNDFNAPIGENSQPAAPSARMRNAAKRRAKKNPVGPKKIAPLPPPTVGVATSAPAPARELPRAPTATPQPEVDEDFLDWDEPILIQEEDYQPFIEASPEPEEEEGEIDPTQATMASLVLDPGVGRVSEKFMQAQKEKEEAKAKRKAYLKRKRESIFGSDFEDMEKSENEDEAAPPQDGDEEGRGDEPAEDQPEEEVVEDEQPEEPEEEYHESHAVVGYRLVDGKMVVDADTLQVDRQAEDLDGDILDEALGSRRVNSSTYSNRKASARWTVASTDKFYEAIQQNGSDFAMIALYFRDEGRTRAQIKSKWKREEKLNSHRITAALNNRKPRGDLAALGEQFGLDLTGDIPEDPMEKYYDAKPGIKKSSQTPQLGDDEDQPPREGTPDDTLPPVYEEGEPPDQVQQPIEEVIEGPIAEE